MIPQIYSHSQAVVYTGVCISHTLYISVFLIQDTIKKARPHP